MNNNELEDAYKAGYNDGYVAGYGVGYETAWNAHNSRPDERNRDERTVITTEEVRTEIGRIKDCIDDLYDRVKRLESVVFYGGKA